MQFRNIFSFHEKMEDRVRARIGYYVCLLILSILIGVFYRYINHHNILLGNDPDYVNLVLTYISHGLFVVSILLIIEQVRLLKNKEKMHKVEICENDERNQLISMKAYAYTCKGAIMGCFVGSVVTAFQSMYLSKSLFIVGLCLIFVVFVINRFLQKYM